MSFMCCRIEQGWDKHIKGHRFFAFHNFRNSLHLKRAVFYISECFKKFFGVQNFRVFNFFEHLPYILVNLSKQFCL